MEAREYVPTKEQKSLVTIIVATQQVLQKKIPMNQKLILNRILYLVKVLFIHQINQK